MHDDLPFIDIITVNYNGEHFLADYLEGLKNQSYPKERIRIFFVDNASQDSSLDFLEQSKDLLPITVIKNQSNLGFAKANNIALRESKAKYVVLLNNDTKIDPNFLYELVSKIEQDPRIGICEAKQLPLEHPKYYNPETFETSWCVGGGCVVRRAALEEVGFFDESFFMYLEDIDLSWRMWLNGWKCVYNPKAKYIHKTVLSREGMPSDTEIYYTVRNGILMRLTYGKLWDILWFYLRIGRVVVFSRVAFRERVLFLKGFFTHIFLIPHAVKKRILLRGKRRKWVQFKGVNYGPGQQNR